GSTFTGATGVTFGGVAASFTFVSDTQLIATAPSQAVAATVDVIVRTPTGTSAVSSSDHFTYSAASAPTVTGVTASSGSTVGGDSVLITGTNFIGATEVKFGSESATFTVLDAAHLSAVVPSQAA